MSLVPYDEIEKRTQFFHVGGLTFHTVFVWVQQKDNHPGESIWDAAAYPCAAAAFYLSVQESFCPGEKAAILAAGAVDAAGE